MGVLVERRTPGPRILLAGGHIAESQFSRNLKALGCTVEWYDGKPSRTFPRFCDALVVAKYQISHEGFWQAKAAYKGKPMFIADHSWSTIKHKVEEYVAIWKHNNKPKTTILGEAMSKAINNNGNGTVVDARKTIDGKDVSKLPDTMRVWYSDEMRDRIKQAVLAHYNAGLGPIDAAKEMGKLGLTLAGGGPLTAQSVSSWRKRLNLAGGRSKASSAAKTPVVDTAPAPKPREMVPDPRFEPKPQPKAADKIVYELILHANLPAIETTALMRRCMDGKLSQEECLKFIELYTDLKGG